VPDLDMAGARGAAVAALESLKDSPSVLGRPQDLPAT
jgi:hypothetical protein